METEINIGEDSWLKKCVDHMGNIHWAKLQYLTNEEQKIIINMKDIKDDRDHKEYVSKILEKLKMNGIFEQCQYLHIMNPTKSVSQDLYQLIGKLSSIKTIIFESMTFFPMIRIINKIPDDTILELLKMDRIATKQPQYKEYLEDEAYVDEDEMHECISRILSCKTLSICKWSNPGEYGCAFLATFQRKFRHSKSIMPQFLHEKSEKCPIKVLEYYGGGMIYDINICIIWYLFVSCYVMIFSEK